MLPEVSLIRPSSGRCDARGHKIAQVPANSNDSHADIYECLQEDRKLYDCFMAARGISERRV